MKDCCRLKFPTCIFLKQVYISSSKQENIYSFTFLEIGLNKQDKSKCNQINLSS